MRRWNRRLSLVGPGTVDQVLERHYGEALAALPLLRDDDRSLVDLGSGAGFPGFVLAAARPGLEVTMVEARERKWAFLQNALRRCAAVSAPLSCRAVNARVGPLLPAGIPERIDVVTSRALRMSPELFDLFLERGPHRDTRASHRSRLRFLLWQGVELAPLPTGWRVERELQLAGSIERRIVEICRL